MFLYLNSDSATKPSAGQLTSSFWFTEEDILTVAKKVCLTGRFFNGSPGPCCFSPFIYRNAKLSTCIGQIQPKCTHLYITNFEWLNQPGPKIILDWSLKTHMLSYTSVLEVLTPQPLRQPGSPWKQKPQSSNLWSQQPYVFLSVYYNYDHFPGWPWGEKE